MGSIALVTKQSTGERAGIRQLENLLTSQSLIEIEMVAQAFLTYDP